MLDVLFSKTDGERWADWRECVPDASSPADALVCANELRARGYRIERRGPREEEAYRILEPPPVSLGSSRNA